MRPLCKLRVGIIVFLSISLTFPFIHAPDSQAQTSQPSEETLKFDPKKTDDLLEKIELIDKAFTYRRGGRRDPFGPLLKSRDLLEQEMKEREGSWELFCEPGYDPSLPLSKFELDTLQLEGVVWGGLGIKALLKGPDGKAYNIKQGDFIGTNCGKVINVANKYIKVEEKYRNEEGRIRIDYKYKVLKPKETTGATEKEGEEGTAKLEPGSPTQGIVVNIDAEENTLLLGKGDAEKLSEGDKTVIGRAKAVTLGPGDYEAVIVGGAFNIDFPKTTRFKARVTIYIPSVANKPSRVLNLGLDTEFTSHNLTEAANLGQMVRFALPERMPVFFFFNDEDFNNNGVMSVSVSRLLTLEEVKAAREATETEHKESPEGKGTEKTTPAADDKEKTEKK